MKTLPLARVAGGLVLWRKPAKYPLRSSAAFSSSSSGRFQITAAPWGSPLRTDLPRRAMSAGKGVGLEDGVLEKDSERSPREVETVAMLHEMEQGSGGGGDGGGGGAAQKPSEARGQEKAPEGSLGGSFNDKRRGTAKAFSALVRKRLAPKVEHALSYINDKSGWTEVNRLKAEISDLEERLIQSQSMYRNVRGQHREVAQEHRLLQGEINALSLTKHSWTDEQFQYYQQLLATDRTVGSRLAKIEVQMREGEESVDTRLRELMEGLRRRFHEEQLWTDRIRMLSMWSTIAILTANSLIFLVTFLVRSRESAYVRSVVEDIRSEISALSSQQASLLPAAAAGAAVPASSAKGGSRAPQVERTQGIAGAGGNPVEGEGGQDAPATFPGGLGGSGAAGGADGGEEEAGRQRARAAMASYSAAAMAAGVLFGRIGQ